jgi:hypothetical protein
MRPKTTQVKSALGAPMEAYGGLDLSEGLFKGLLLFQFKSLTKHALVTTGKHNLVFSRHTKSFNTTWQAFAI